MINSTHTNSTSVAELVPSASSQPAEQPRAGGAFAEALAGARTVADRSDRTVHPSTAAAHDRRANGTDHVSDQQETTDTPQTDAADTADVVAVQGSAGDDDTTAEAAGAVVELDETHDPLAVADDAAAADAAAAAASLAVDAVILPTAATPPNAQVSSDAVDAALRLAIDAGGDAPIAFVTAPVAPVDLTVATDEAAAIVVDEQPTARMQTARGTEVATDGDVQAGPMRPSTSTPTVASGPEPALTAAAADDVSLTTPTLTTAPAAAPIAAQASEATTDAAPAAPVTVTSAAAEPEATPLSAALQATVVAAASVEAGTEPAPDVDATSSEPVAVTATAPTTASDAGAANAGSDEETDRPPLPAQAAAAAVEHSNRTVTTPASAFAAQLQATGEDAAEEAPADSPAADPLLGNQAQAIAPTRAEQVAPGVRLREGLFAGAGIQERIDHIAEQLATRLRLSHAAGGTEVQLNLKPRELGEVTVQMRVRDGAVAATVLVDRQDTLRTMQTNIEELKRSLENQGLQIQQFNVDVRGEAGAGGANARAAAEQHRSGRASSNATAPLAGVAAMPGLSGDRTVSHEDIHDGDVSVLA